MNGADDGQQVGGDKWGDEISDERKAELEQRLQAWEQEADHGESKGPFDYTGLSDEEHAKFELSGADVFWLAARMLAATSEAYAVAEQMERLRQARDDEVLRFSLRLDGLHLERANLYGAHLEHAFLNEAHLAGAALSRAHLAGADLRGAHLERAFLSPAHLEGADLRGAHLERALLNEAHMAGANLRGAYLEHAFLNEAHLAGATFGLAHLEGADLREAQLGGAELSRAHLEGADLREAHLGGAELRGAHLEGKVYKPGDVDYQRMRQWVEDFPQVIAPADLRGAFLNSATTLNDITLGRGEREAGQGYVQVADVRWGGVNLAVVKDWPPQMVLGDEREAWAWQPLQRKAAQPISTADEKPSRKERAEARRGQEQKWQDEVAEATRERLELFRAAVRANRQVATVLRDQGMNEEADRFFYRAQVCQRQVFRLRHQRARQTFSWLLDVVSGHGYQPGKTLAWYLAVIFTFTGAYLAASHGILTFGLPPSSFGKLAWYEALVLSVSSFHGRGFLPFPNLGDPVTILAAIEAVFGLFIEVSFIATFTQRYFGK